MRNEDKKKDMPSPEEFQKQLSDFMKEHFSGFPLSGFGPKGKNQSSAAPPEESKERSIEDLKSFEYRPKDVKAYLDRFVIKQDEAKSPQRGTMRPLPPCPTGSGGQGSPQLCQAEHHSHRPDREWEKPTSSAVWPT